MIEKYLIIGAILVALSGGVAFTLKLYMDEKVSHAITTQSLVQITNQLEQYELDLANLRVNQVELEGKNLDITLEHNQDIRTLDGLRNREATVLKKRSLISLRINKAFQKRQRSLACTTGDFTLCE